MAGGSILINLLAVAKIAIIFQESLNIRHFFGEAKSTLNGQYSIAGHSAAITPTATAAPTARIDCVGIMPGTLPQAIDICDYSAR